MCGSHSAGNEIDFWTASGALVGKIKISDPMIASLGLLNKTDDPSGYLIRINVDDAHRFQKVTFVGNQEAFEVAGVSAVPIPGALPLFGASLIGLAAVARRKQRSAAA